MITIDQKKHDSFNQIKKFCELSTLQEKKLADFVSLLLSKNQNYNFIGNSTIENIWERHILDCAQLLKFIDNYNLKFADFGSGAGLPGIVLSILGLKEIHLVEKSFRKCEFLHEAKLLSSNRVFIANSKLEDLDYQSYDCIVSRALAPLPKLLEYNIKFLKDDGFCLFLKERIYNLKLRKVKKILNLITSFSQVLLQTKVILFV